MLTKSLIQTLVLLTVPTAVFAKRGGGGGDIGSIGDDGNGGGDGGGDASGDSCINPGPFLQTWDMVPDYVSGQNVTAGGAYFQGEAFFNYKIPKWANDLRDPSKIEWRSRRMLGYAWVGPQQEYPTGSTNPFLLGFKAWGSQKPVQNISTSYSYVHARYCPLAPDLVKFVTTMGTDHEWTRLENTDNIVHSYFAQRAADVFSLNATASTTDPEAVDISARYRTDDPDLDINQSVYVIRLYDDQHQTDGEWIDIGWSKGITINGSITNTTLDLNIAGNTTMKIGYLSSDLDEWDAAINVTFSGTFHSANSTEKLSIRQKNQPLVSFKSNNSTRVAYLNYAIGMVWTICIALLSGQFL